MFNFFSFVSGVTECVRGAAAWVLGATACALEDPLAAVCLLVGAAMCAAGAAAALVISKKLQIRACWIVGSAIFALGMIAYGNFIVIATALLIPVFFEVLYPVS